MPPYSRTANGARPPPGDSTMRERVEDRDWSQSSLGPRQQWDPALANAVSLCLDSSFPLLVLAGPDLVCLYNAAAIPLIEGKPPWAFGRPAQEVWPETWSDIGPMLRGVQQTGKAVRHSDLPLLVQRKQGTQRLYFTFSYSPVTNARGEVVAVFVVSLETTDRVIQERRLAMLNQLASAIASAQNVDQTFDCAARALLTNPEDLPLSALYMCEHNGELRLAFVASHLTDADQVLPACMPASEGRNSGDHPIQRSLHSGQVQLFDLPLALAGEHGVARSRAVALRISLPGALTTEGVFVAVLNPLLPWDENYRSFLTVVLGHLGTGLAANEAAQKTSSFLSIVFDNAPSGIAIADASGVLIRANDAYADLFGMDKDELIGRFLHSLHARESWPDSNLQDLLQRATANISRQTRYLTAHHGAVWVAEQMSLVRDAGGLPKFIVITTKDITQTVLAKQEAEAAQNELRGLYERLQNIREEERVAIAREVHDQLGQVLSAAKIDVDLLRESLTRHNGQPSREDMLAELNSAQSSLDRALQLVKVIARELRGARLQEQGLYAAVAWHARDFEQRTRIRCRVLIAEALYEPDGEAAVTLFRILQEALTNVLRHALASDVTVSFHLRGPAIKLRVRDNGVGIAREAARDPASLGIRGMRERAALQRGRLLVGAMKPGGTLLSALVPLPPEEKGAPAKVGIGPL